MKVINNHTMLLQLNNKNVRLNSLIDGVVFRLKSYCSYSGIITVYIDFMAIISVSLHISMFGCGFIIELRHFKVNKSKIHRYSDLVAVDVLCYFFFIEVVDTVERRNTLTYMHWPLRVAIAAVAAVAIIIQIEQPHTYLYVHKSTSSECDIFWLASWQIHWKKRSESNTHTQRKNNLFDKFVFLFFSILFELASMTKFS